MLMLRGLATNRSSSSDFALLTTAQQVSSSECSEDRLLSSALSGAKQIAQAGPRVRQPLDI